MPGTAHVSAQTANGIEYLKNFPGAEAMIVSSEIPPKTVLAIPADNICMGYRRRRGTLCVFQESVRDYTFHL